MKWRRAATVLLVLWAVWEIGRSLTRLDGVIFTGYTQVGEVVLQGGDPYGLAINTWPPFFLFIAAVLALLARVSLPGVLLLWQVGSVLSVWGSCRFLHRLAGEEPPPFTHAAILVPVLMSARLLQEHVQHTQINLFLLLLILVAFWAFQKGRFAAGGLALAAAASLRAVPILFLPYLLYKRSWRAAGWMSGWLLVLNVALPLVAFGPTTALQRWRSWRTVAAAETADPVPGYSNQSLLAALKRVLTADASARDPLRYAIASWPVERVRTLFFLLLAAGAVGLALFFRRHPSSLGEITIGLTLLPLVSPLAWKAHFVTLLAGYWFVWRSNNPPRILWWASFACLTLSASALWGGRVSHTLESLNVITAGALLVAITQLRRQPPTNSAAPTPP